jgi:hypothetical protein
MALPFIFSGTVNSSYFNTISLFRTNHNIVVIGIVIHTPTRFRLCRH